MELFNRDDVFFSYLSDFSYFPLEIYPENCHKMSKGGTFLKQV
jgi:hypothetical protein